MYVAHERCLQDRFRTPDDSMRPARAMMEYLRAGSRLTGRGSGGISLSPAPQSAARTCPSSAIRPSPTSAPSPFVVAESRSGAWRVRAQDLSDSGTS